jgi:hypothetical protein
MDFSKIVLQVISLVAVITFTDFSYAETVEVTDASELDKLNRLASSLKAEFENGPFNKKGGWKLAKKKKGVTVYTRDVDYAPMGQFRGEMEVKVDMQRLAMFFNDDQYYPEWMYLMDVSRVIKQLSETEYFVYTENQPIWPCKIRDTYTFKWWEQDPKTDVVTARFIGVPDFGPKKKGFVRVKLLMGKYTITPKSDGYVHLKYEALTDPDLSSWVPDWAVKFTLKWTSYLTLVKVKKMLPLERYKGKTLSWLKVPESNIVDKKSIPQTTRNTVE